MASLRDWFYWIYDNDKEIYRCCIESMLIKHSPQSVISRVNAYDVCKAYPEVKAVLLKLHKQYVNGERPESSILLSGWKIAVLRKIRLKRYNELILGLSDSACLDSIKFTPRLKNKQLVSNWAVCSSRSIDKPGSFTLGANRYYVLKELDNKQEVTLLELRQLIDMSLPCQFHLVYRT